MRATVSDIKHPVYSTGSPGVLLGFTADLRSVMNYYSFACLAFGEGMEMPGRCGNSGNYRYGFNTQEKDDEIYGSGNSYTAEYWQYDSRLGRRWNVDPVVKEFESSYACFANNPVWFIDYSGRDTTFFQEDGSYDLQAKTDFESTLGIVKERVKTLENEISSLQNELSAGGLSKREIKKKNKALIHAKQSFDEWRSLESDFDNILSSKALFRYTSNTTLLSDLWDGAVLGTHSTVIRNTEGELLEGTVILIAIRTHKLGTYIHENRHLVQIINNLPYTGYELERELDAFEAQAIFDPKSILEWRRRAHDSFYGKEMGAQMPLISLERGIKYVYELK